MFRDNVVQKGPVREHIQNTLLDLVMKERNGELIDRLAVMNTCQILINLGILNRTVYEEEFEKPFLRESSEFYRVRKIFTLKNIINFYFIFDKIA